MTSQISLSAPAKINLFLHVVGRFEDGMHDLESLVSFADVGDRILIEPAEAFSFQVRGPFAASLPSCDIDDNLVVRAASMMARRFEREMDFALTLEKNLPVSAGIGGGSSDAAAIIRGLLDWWNIADYPADLGHELGSDVPVCLRGTSALMRGRGEILSAVPEMPRLACVLVNPLIGCSTPNVFQAYKNLGTAFSDPVIVPEKFPDYKSVISFLSQCRNDLLDAACSVVPETSEALDSLRDTGSDLVRLSGSGATCFGLFDSSEKAKAAAAHIQSSYPKWWSCSTILL